MIRRRIIEFFVFGCAVVLLETLLFAPSTWRDSTPFNTPIFAETTFVLRDAGTQWLVFVCLGGYFAGLVWVRTRHRDPFLEAHNPALWLACVLLTSAGVYAFQNSSNIDALMLSGGAVIGQAAGWAVWEDGTRRERGTGEGVPGKGGNLRGLIVAAMIVLLSLASLRKDGAPRSFEYHGDLRWTGPWDNPNNFGLLMGTGVTLAIGTILTRFRSVVQGAFQRRCFEPGKWLLAILFIAAAAIMARGLLHSYSRGAWLATACGMGYLALLASRLLRIAFAENSASKATVKRRFCHNAASAGLIVASIAVITFWQFRHTEWTPARRAVSATSARDFSWRNRVSAWEGAWQTTVEHSLLGAGWGQPERLYEHFYLRPALTDGAAIEMNDHLMLGATLGMPALFCFGMYVWLSLRRKSEIGDWRLEIPEVNWLQTTCRAGAIVLLVGFWFDGGLFKLPTAATFWILLESGSVNNHESHEPAKHLNR